MFAKTIIHNLTINVNSPNNSTKTHDVCSKFDKIAQRKKAALTISGKLHLIGEEKRAILMRACNTVLEIYKCGNCGKTKVLNAHLCRDRLCPTCQYLLSVKRYNQMQETIKHVNISAYEWRFITLTIRNCSPEDLSLTISQMLKSWDRVCKRRTIKRILKGWGRSLEITYNKNVGSFHPHIHILAAFEKGCAPNLNEVSTWWKEAMDLSYKPICDIEIPYSKKSDSITSAMIEAFKYATKSKEVADMPLSSFSYLVNAIKGVRLLAFGGIVRKARAELGLKEDDIAETEIIEDKCCGSEMQKAIAKWSFDTETYKIIEGYTDEDK